MTHTLKRIMVLSLCFSILLGLFSGMTVSGKESSVQLVTAPKKNSQLAELTAALKAEINALPTSGALRNGRVRLSDFRPSADGSNEVKELRGKHFLVRGESNGHYIIDGSWTGTNGELPMKLGTHVDGNAAYFTGGASPTMAFEFHYRGISQEGMPLYVLKFNNGRNLAVGSRYANWNNLYYVMGDTTTDLNAAHLVRFEHPAGVNWIRISNAFGTHGLRQSSDMKCVRWKDNSAGDNDYAGNSLFLYRTWSTREIITAIHDMKGYLDTPEFFDEGVYGQFLTCLRESIDLFRQYNPWPSTLIDPYDFIQEKLDAKVAELRSFASRLSFEVEAPPAAELNAKTTIHQLPLACGYVIQTRGGKIIVIDGGWQDNNTEGKYLFSYLQKITGDATPHIDAWFITHAHADHHGCVPTFANLYKNQVTIDAFYYHYPTYEEIQKYLSGCGVQDSWGAADWLPTWLLPNFRNAQGGPTKGIHCNTKQSGKCNNAFDFDDVHIEILLTFEDVIWAVENVSGRYSGTSANEGRVFSNKTFKELLNDNFNETSMVFRVTVGGKSILFTGDINYIGGYMLNMFHDLNAANSNDFYTLKSDYVQVSHHGHYGLPKKVYNKIDPDVAMWPCNYDEWNDYDYQNLICTKQWFNDMGSASYVAYQGPHIFEFPLVRSEGAINIPSELKDYVFNAEYYSAKYPDLARLYGNDARKLYYHFMNYGIEEGRSASPFFDVKYYANQNGHHLVDTFKGNYIAAFKDFLSIYKTNTLRKLSENFDAATYAFFHADLTAQGISTNFDYLKHYAENGYKRGETASVTFLCDDRNMTYHYFCNVTQPVAPTCTTEGKTIGAQCITCGLVLEEPKSVPATGHNFANGACVCGLEIDAHNLYFDFTNTPEDQERYTHSVYGGYNFDRSNSPYWATASTGGTNKLSIDNAAGTMRVNVLSQADSAGNYGPFIKTTNTPGTYPWSGEEYRQYHPLNYNPEQADYMQLRFKLEGCTNTDKQAMVVACYNSAKDGVGKGYEDIAANFDPNSTDYQVINIPLTNENFVGADLITALGFRFRNIKGAAGTVISNGVCEGILDSTNFCLNDGYIARGNYSVSAKMQGTMSFPNTTLVQEGIIPWYQDANNYLFVYVQWSDSDRTEQMHQVHISGKVNGEHLGWGDCWTDGVTISNDTALTMTVNKEVVNGCVKLSYVLSNGEISLSNSRTFDAKYTKKLSEDGRMGVYAYGNGIPVTFSGFTSTAPTTTLGNDSWTNLTEHYTINGNGSVVIDYIFVGKKDEAPAPMYEVTFTDSEGKVLSTALVAEGGTVEYSGSTPTKAYDKVNHYNFSGWDKALTNIRGNTTFTAQFTAEAHSYSYTSANAQSHKGACACGYSKSEDHSYTAYAVTKEPTVSTTGALTGTCTLCSDTATVTLPKLNTTDYTKTTILEPTCTDHGKDSYEWNETGYGSFSFTATTKALGHQVQTISGKAPTCTSSGMSDGEFCTRCEKTLKAQEVLPRLGHDYVYVNMGQNHEIRCSRCTKVSTAAHSYENGTCLCGATEQITPSVDQTIVMNHTLNLASDISVNFAVKTDLLKNYVNHRLVVEIPVYEGNTRTGTKTVTIEPVLNGTYYYYTLTGLTAIHMGDVVTARLYMEKDGQTYVSPADTYSIAQYAYAQLNKTAAKDSLKTLCADLLRYGKEAQVFKAYRTDALVDANMTDTHRAYLSNAEAITFGNTDAILADPDKPQITWAGKALNLESKVSVKYIFNLGNYNGKVENLTAKVRYVNRTGAVVEAVLRDPQIYDAAKGLYSFTFDGLLAAELRSVTEVAVYEGDTRLSQTLRYSPDTYGNNKKGQLLILCKALFAYVDSAKAYFG